MNVRAQGAYKRRLPTRPLLAIQHRRPKEHTPTHRRLQTPADERQSALRLQRIDGQHLHCRQAAAGVDCKPRDRSALDVHIREADCGKEEVAGSAFFLSVGVRVDGGRPTQGRQIWATICSQMRRDLHSIRADALPADTLTPSQTQPRATPTVK